MYRNEIICYWIAPSKEKNPKGNLNSLRGRELCKHLIKMSVSWLKQYAVGN